MKLYRYWISYKVLYSNKMVSKNGVVLADNEKDANTKLKEEYGTFSTITVEKRDIIEFD